MECAGNGRALLQPAPGQPAVAGRGGRHRRVDRHAARAAAARRPASRRTPSTSSSPAPTTASSGASSRTTSAALPLAEALRDEVLLAYEMNGAPLPPQHGFPLRLVVPGWYGMAHVKWLTRITVVDRAVHGYQNAVAYRLRSDAGRPRRAGDPHPAARAAATRRASPTSCPAPGCVRAGPTTVDGRAWSGQAPITAVEVTVDGGKTWSPAELQERGSRTPGGRWRWSWDAQPGRYVTGRARHRCHRPGAAGRRAVEPGRLRQQLCPADRGLVVVTD